MTPDVNVLVAASRSDHPHHDVALTWLNKALAQAAAGSQLALMPLVLSSFLRSITSPKNFVSPTPVQDALRFCDALLSAPGVQRPALGAEWPALRQLCLERALSGNDLPDAWLAAAVLHQGEHLVTFDKDFRRLLPRGRFTLLLGT